MDNEKGHRSGIHFKIGPYILDSIRETEAHTDRNKWTCREAIQFKRQESFSAKSTYLHTHSAYRTYVLYNAYCIFDQKW